MTVNQIEQQFKAGKIDPDRAMDLLEEHMTRSDAQGTVEAWELAKGREVETKFLQPMKKKVTEIKAILSQFQSNKGTEQLENKANQLTKELKQLGEEGMKQAPKGTKAILSSQYLGGLEVYTKIRRLANKQGIKTTDSKTRDSVSEIDICAEQQAIFNSLNPHYKYKK